MSNKAAEDETQSGALLFVAVDYGIEQGNIV